MEGKRAPFVRWSGRSIPECKPLPGSGRNSLQHDGEWRRFPKRMAPCSSLRPQQPGKPPGAESVLYSFTGGADGGEPTGDIIDDSGVFYSTSQRGGNVGPNCPHLTLGCGTVFSLTAPASRGGAWTESVLHAFDFADGASPAADSSRRTALFTAQRFLGAGAEHATAAVPSSRLRRCNLHPATWARPASLARRRLRGDFAARRSSSLDGRLTTTET